MRYSTILVLDYWWLWASYSIEDYRRQMELTNSLLMPSLAAAFSGADSLGAADTV